MKTIEEYLSYFDNEGYHLQLTLSYAEERTVHAFHVIHTEPMHETSGKTILEALEKMKQKVSGNE
jgi:hypothetical protein